MQLNHEPNGFMRLVRHLGALLAIIGLSFTAGYNWYRINRVEEKIADVQQDYARKDVLAESFMRLEAQLRYMNDQIEEIRRRGERRQQEQQSR